MIEKITIKSIEVRSGISKSGRGYNMVVITTRDDRKMSLYADKEYDLKFKKVEKASELKAGDNVLVKVEQNGEYLNWDFPSKYDELEDRVTKLEEIISRAQKKAA